jgi:hypothetical protein
LEITERPTWLQFVVGRVRGRPGRWVIGAPMRKWIPLETSTAIRVAGFGVAIACVLAPLFLSDMVFIAPILVAGAVVAVIGIWTTSGARIPVKASLSALAALAFVSEGALHYFHHVRPGEDLLASFFVAGIDRNIVHYRFTFMNRGNEPASVRALGLFEVAAARGDQDPIKNLELCRQIRAKDLGFNDGDDRQYLAKLNSGSDGFRYTLYRPQGITVDHAPFGASRWVSVESGQQAVVTATFALDPSYARDSEIAVLCPTITSTNTQNVSEVAVCEGSVITTQMTGDTNTFDLLATPATQFRVLPHLGTSNCPPS